MEFGLKKRVALITGAASGIGKAIAFGFAGEGTNLALCDINLDLLEKVAAELRVKGIRVFTQKVDVTKQDQTDAFINRAYSEFGRIDILS